MPLSSKNTFSCVLINNNLLVNSAILLERAFIKVIASGRGRLLRKISALYILFQSPFIRILGEDFYYKYV